MTTYQSIDVGGRKAERKYSRSASVTGGRRHAVRTDEDVVKYPHEDHAELDGTLKAFVFGFNDGLSSNTCLMLGIASASSIHPQLVLASGLVGLFAGAASMGAGEWISGTLTNSAEKGEVQKEVEHLHWCAEAERDHFRENVAELGFSSETISAMLKEMDANKVLRVKAHCKFEMGLEDVWDDEEGKVKESGGSTDTIRAMLFMMFAFSLGALVPLVPWLLYAASIAGGSPHILLISSLLLALAASASVGTIVAKAFTPPEDNTVIVLSQVLAAAAAVAAVYSVGLVYQHIGGSLTAATAAA